MKAWQARNESARAKDQSELVARLDDLETNQGKLLDTLSAYVNNYCLHPDSELCRCTAEQFHGNNGLTATSSTKTVH
jgi:hypothetical protein